MKRARTSSPNQPQDIPQPWSPRDLSVAGGVHALERLALRHLDRRRALRLGGLESELEALHRPGNQLRLARTAVAVPLGGYVDQPAAVGEEVGDVEDVSLHQGARHAAVAERVVGGAGDHTAVEHARQGVVDQATGSAWRE